MTSPTALSPAAEWAAHVSRRRYRRSRHVLDELIVDTVPAYASIVDEELDRFEKGAVKTRIRLDAPYRALWSVSRAGDGLIGVLSAIALVSIAISVALAFPGGGRTGVPVPVEWLPVTIPLSLISFTVAVVAQLARWVPYLHHVPPKDGMAWITIVFGIPVVAWTAWLQQHHVGIPLTLVVVAFVALLVSICVCIARLMRRLRDPRLTKQVDAAVKGRTKALRTAVVSLANASAKRLIEQFEALPEQHRTRLKRELNDAVAELETRHLATAPRTAKARVPKGRQITRGMFPGMLLLSRRVEAVNSQTNGTAQWIVGDFIEDPTGTGTLH